MSDERHLSIGDLVQKTGLSRRTIHYYLHEGLLPSPEGSGRRAYYLEDHLLRLQLISLLREAGLKLDSIGTCLDGLEQCEMRRLVDRADEICLDDPRQLAGWLHRGCGSADDPFLMPEPDGHDDPPVPAGAAEPSAEAREVDGDGPTWVRQEIRRGVELHLRSDLMEEMRPELARLVRIAEALLGGTRD